MYITREERDFLFPLGIILAAEKEGLSVETLREMVRHSTRITHPLGNRRYNGFIFKIEGDEVLAFGRIPDVAVIVPEEMVAAHPAVSTVDAELTPHCESCSDTGRIRVFDTCGRCDGVGCKYCDAGLVPGSVPCAFCPRGSTALG